LSWGVWDSSPWWSGRVYPLKPLLVSSPKYPGSLSHFIRYLVFYIQRPFASRFLSSSSFPRSTAIVNSAVASQSAWDRSKISTKFSFVGHSAVFRMRSSLSRSHLSHTNSVCSGSSRSPQNQQPSVSSFPILRRKDAKHPWPDRAWVR
jgi:hypothetical protein